MSGARIKPDSVARYVRGAIPRAEVDADRHLLRRALLALRGSGPPPDWVVDALGLDGDLVTRQDEGADDLGDDPEEVARG